MKLRSCFVFSKVTADADELTVDLKFINKRLLESIYEQEIETNQCVRKNFLLYILRVRLFQIYNTLERKCRRQFRRCKKYRSGLYVPNTVAVRRYKQHHTGCKKIFVFRRLLSYPSFFIFQMVSRKVSNQLKTVSQCTPLTQLILQCYKERGPEQEHKKLPYRKMLQIMYEIVDADGNTSWSDLPPLPKDTAPLPPPPPPPAVMLKNYLESPPSVVSDNASLPDAVVLNSDPHQLVLDRDKVFSWKTS